MTPGGRTRRRAQRCLVLLEIRENFILDKAGRETCTIENSGLVDAMDNYVHPVCLFACRGRIPDDTARMRKVVQMTAGMANEAINMDKTTDPVCGMTVAREQAAGKSEYQGTTFYFCSTSCKTRFDADPEKFASGANA